MWWTLLALLLVISITVSIRKGPREALGVGVMLSLLLPCWIVHRFFGQPIDLRIAITLILLLMRLFDPRAKICWRFNAGDWAIFVMFFVHVASDTWQDGFSFSHWVKAFGEWSIPYIAGRLTIESMQDWNWLTSTVVIVATIMAVSSTTEAISHVNPVNLVFGDRPKDRAPQVMIRNGLKRAEGPTRQPIWFGMMQCLLLPWTIVAAMRSLRGDGPSWWMLTPFCSLCGILMTVSRGPALTGFAIPYLLSTLYWIPMRKPLMIIGVMVFSGGLLFQTHLLRALESVDDSGFSRQIEMDGQQQHLTTISYRWLVVSAYRPAVFGAGLLGYGSARTSSFPVNVPWGPEATQTMHLFWSIDVEFLLILLRFGWFGLAAFIAICVTSIWHITQQSQLLDAHQRLVPIAIAATLTAVTALFLVEWMPSDYGFLFLWLCGAANGPRSSSVTQPSRAAGSARSSQRSKRHRRRLSADPAERIETPPVRDGDSSS